ncbi:MAG: hypothetical protein C0617_11340 [Desulfuromonas sp.]|uniref:c-type cytochrome n=1 Tax=Desulfuromonas sp. TaxID=892 RepID=UPI000CB75EFF|nr:cytochrome c [Desulfuromonas sp.]PLX83513.1 MAG: hypothetical protein C0617_11340 [Desulfuromonas sp.]
MRLALLAAGMLFFLSACSDSPSFPRREPPAALLTDPGSRAAGAGLFARHCAVCHGSPAEGRSSRADFFLPPASSFRESRYRRLDPAYLFWRIEVGKTAEPYRSRGSVMPAWGPHFSEEQIWQIVAYLLGRSGGES